MTRENGVDLLRHALTTALFSSLIAIALAISGRGAWGAQFVYSLSIGMISWVVIDVGRLMMSPDPRKLWPNGFKGVLLVLVGITAGFLGGNAIGDAWTGAPLLEFWTFAPHKFASTLVITAVAGIAICYFYYSRGKSKYLEGEIALAQRDAADARLKLLETQLEPHMLFNTLANLRVLITTDPQRAVAMLDRLNSYLRVTLGGSRALAHPLAAEFDRLGDYLELMSVRMGDRLRYTLDLPDNLRDVLVPPLMLQPLVENSIRHGLEPQVEGGEITVRARREGGQLVIEVSDTGVGIGHAPAPSSAEAGGFGVAQVRERLTTVYGAQSSMTMSALATGGTCATITFPLPT
ncbi:histidine kinase [Variovorax sp. J2P1-59]|uniref:sensor histidine kinase n=1 Tax=Variovorax flavidus TaxID=3053501 RepID=UPI00257611B5|nr:histidine kinase [Variovorax sp. J2P1-59]MDM0074308.1 histidine kinase [Variovorax sp. J2P1-59]